MLCNFLQVAGVAAVEAAHDNHHVDGGVICDLVQGVLALLTGSTPSSAQYTTGQNIGCRTYDVCRMQALLQALDGIGSLDTA